MHYFPVLMFQHWVLAFFLGLIGVILTCLAFGIRWHGPGREEVKEIEEIKKDGGIHLNLTSQFRSNPHGVFLLLIYLGVVFYYIAYYFLVGLDAGGIY
jgi:hypothetical protein